MKKSRLLGVVAVLMVAAWLGNAYSSVGENRDWQLWNTEKLSGKLNDQWKATGAIEFRFGDDIGELYYGHSELMLTTEIAENWTLAPSYRQIFSKSSGLWNEENRPQVDLAYKWVWGDYKLSNRARLEYRVRDGKDNDFRFRDKLTLSLPQEIGSFKPYVADEIFYDFEVDQFNVNRIYLGFKTSLGGPAKLNLFYMRQDAKKSGNWDYLNVIGVALQFAF